MSVYKGIDVSKWQGRIDWSEVKADGVEFAIIREGYGKENPNQVDKRFEENYKGAKAAGIPVGVYFYTYADSNSIIRANFIWPCLVVCTIYSYVLPSL